MQHIPIAVLSTVGSFLGFQLHTFIKLDLCFSEQRLLCNVDSLVHVLDCNREFASNIMLQTVIL